MKLVPMVEIIWERYSDGYNSSMYIGPSDYKEGEGKWVEDTHPLYKALAPVLAILERVPDHQHDYMPEEEIYHLTMTEYTAITGKEQLP